MADLPVSLLYTSKKDGEKLKYWVTVENRHINRLEINLECVMHVIKFSHACCGHQLKLMSSSSCQTKILTKC